jgi:hypothetical protein
MKCPHCSKTISDKIIARFLAGKAGKKTSERKKTSSAANLPKPKWGVVFEGMIVSAHILKERAELVARHKEKRTGRPHAVKPLN